MKDPERTSVGVRARAAWIDAHNRARYGRDAPRVAELVWVDPRECTTVIERPGFYRRSTGRVHRGDWPATDGPAPDPELLAIADRRWVRGLPWRDTGEVERMRRLLASGNASDGVGEDGILDRCARLDALFAVVRREGRLRTRAELDPRAFRELGGVGVHVGPDGGLVKAGGGHHRFAIAHLLGLTVIPAQLGVVHADAIGVLPRLRIPPQGAAGLAGSPGRWGRLPT